MKAVFRASGSFHIPEKKFFCIPGDITQGNVKAGMIVNIPFNSCLSMTAPIHAIEIASTSSGTRIVLVIDLGEDDEAEIWKGLNLGGGEMLEIEAAPEDLFAAQRQMRVTGIFLNVRPLTTTITNQAYACDARN